MYHISYLHIVLETIWTVTRCACSLADVHIAYFRHCFVDLRHKCVSHGTGPIISGCDGGHRHWYHTRGVSENTGSYHECHQHVGDGTNQDGPKGALRYGCLCILNNRSSTNVNVKSGDISKTPEADA